MTVGMSLDRSGAPRAPVVIALPTGLPLSGITTWAVRLASALADRAGRRVALLIHDHDEAEAQPDDLGLSPRVQRIPVRGGPSIRACRGDYRAFLPTYRATVERLAAESGAPVVAIPSLDAECAGIFACLAQASADPLRVVSWTHNDIAYDYRAAQRHEPLVARFAGISRRITTQLAHHLPSRTADIRYVPSLVPAAPSLPHRAPLAGRPLRLIYTGRFEHEQKRIGALLAMSDGLARRAISHQLTLIGDGAARDEVLARAAGAPDRIRVISRNEGGAPPGMAALLPLLAEADVFVLPSRYEGACISMLEAMGQGAIPIVPRDVVASIEAIEPHHAGALAACDRNDDEHAAGEALADAVASLASRSDLPARAERCRRLIAERHSERAHLDAALDVIDSAAASPARWWPATLPCSPSASDAASGGEMTVPADAPARCAAALARLGALRIALWGAGRHTLALAPVLAHACAQIVAIIDDDPRRHARPLLGWPVCDPSQAAALGATDVLISSWMHEPAMWERRAHLERLGLRVHRMYADDSSAAADAA